ncbi:MAG: hypothetical protein BGN96_13740 [Bacteroidales bacterium 45-6]|nr:MAG: hypothetical protein BGN96_13740 [Bacteroidales bacterium 45-6]
MPIFSTDKETAIDQLAEVAKVNRNSPWNVFRIYIEDAKAQFLLPYLGSSLLGKIEATAETSQAEADAKYLALIPMVRRALGPYAVGISTDEASISTGDSGHTVAKSDKFSPASDNKIALAKESLLSRAWVNMEILLAYLEEHSADYQEWKDTRYHKNRKTKFFASAEEFQDHGLVDIDYSRLAFERLRMLVMRVEQSEVANLLGGNETAVVSGTEDKDKKMLALVRQFIGARVAQLHTSKTTRVQRSKSAELEFKAVIRPAFDDESTDWENYYTQQADFWRGKILEALAADYETQASGKVDWDNEGKHIFFAG